MNTPPPEPATPSAPALDERAERLARQLRENLRRRKAQARALADDTRPATRSD